MTALEIIQQLETASPQPVYFLYGEEDFFQRELVAALTRRLITPDNRDFNYESFDAKSSAVETWIEAAQTLSFLGGIKLVLVRGLDERTLDDKEVKRLLDYVDDPAPEACLVMTARKADRKRKLYKALTKIPGAAECASPKEPALAAWLRQRAKNAGKTLTAEAARQMIGRVGLKPGQLVSELEKVITFAGKTKTLDDRAVAEVVGETRLENVFDLTDALKAKNTARALRILNNHLGHGEEPVKLLGTIAWQYRLIWEVKHHQSTGTPSSRIAQKMGVHPFMAEKALQYTGKFSAAQLREGFRNLSWADRELKSTGRAPEGILKTLVLRLCSAGG
ncbi:MAG: DNA polymerase III subunit delta [Nitrospinaceae bacterium]|nr:DNA polymerase III subunit delta [Nitrospinaceae bacterium]NIR54519.1 DNA polymerase III subunit delta [Nitrospinaceae bacterium]NIS84938.1 DNA polymerase III subunit delta [Nitrospinaceae bacterium]NIT81752.1 DNA polymerase III subunit delta [Nitrospinaceae bacterium]NIU44021.1 DNA polymerase III subunit delta [Nitrospinaceae bacterium]